MRDRVVVVILLLAASPLVPGCCSPGERPQVVSRDGLPTLLAPEQSADGPVEPDRTDHPSEPIPVVHRSTDEQPVTLPGIIAANDFEPSSSWGHTTTVVETPPPAATASSSLPKVGADADPTVDPLPAELSQRTASEVVPPELPPLPVPADGRRLAADLQQPVEAIDLSAERAAAHRIAVGDELVITFPHRPTFNQTVMVQEDGRITLPLIEPVTAAGLTPAELGRELTRSYRELQYDPLEARNGAVEKKYLVSTGDRLEVRFDAERPESELGRLSDTVTVRPDGKISLPLIGTVTAEGRTPEELEAEIAGRYRKFYKEAEPVLIVREFTSNRVLVDGRLTRPGMKNIDDVVVLTKKYERVVFVAGEVNKPGFVKLAGPMCVSQAIIGAGGCKRTAELQSVAMFRRGPGNQPIATTLDLRGCWRPDKPNLPVEDLPCRSGDVIIVPKTTIARVNDTLDQYIYQLIPMTRNTQFQYIYQTGAAVGVFGF